MALAAGSCVPGAGSSGAGLVSIGAGLRGLAGLRATVYATGPPTVSALALDERGRLWVATAAYTSEGEDAVSVVATPGAAPVRVVTGLRTPLGLAWRDGWLYVASLGRVDAFGGFDGSRFAERRTVLEGPVAEGENNGLALTADGRLLMGVSASCDHCTPASRWSAAIVSFGTDGGGLGVYASGLRAPFGLTLSRDDLFVTVNQRDDLGGGTPGDWLAVVRQGERWGFPDCWGQGGSTCAGVPAPAAVLDQHAAAGGVALVSGALAGRGSSATAAIVAEWALGRVQRVALTRTDGAYRGTAAPFLAGLKNPLPVLATGGGVLVGDWGTGRIYLVEAASASGA